MTVPTSTDLTACAMMVAPHWLQEANPYITFAGMLLGGLWIAVQLYYKVRNESFRKKD